MNIKSGLKASFSLVALYLLSSAAHAAISDNNEAIRKGEYLATVGDCAACHSVAGHAPFTGGLKMPTPVGDIYSTNITPAPKTGIGQYTYDDFAKALREGIAKDGHHLYPAMPYTSFAKVNDGDMQALYAYFMNGVKPVEQANRESDIPWPLNMRWPLLFWNWAFHDNKVYQPSSRKSEQWNRGAYLVQGLGHCGACHTPRGVAFEEKALDQNESAYLTGGAIDGWSASDLTGNVHDGLGRWSAQDLTQFLKTGRTDSSAAFGPMTDVVEQSTQHLTEADIQAIAVYIKSLKSSKPQAEPPSNEDKTSAALMRGDMRVPGAQEYMDNCAACHRIDGKGYAKTFPALAHNSALLGDDPSSLINMVLHGGKMAVTQHDVTGLTMPDFGWRLDDKQVADLVNFVRNSWGNQASVVTPEQVKKIREQGAKVEKKASDKAKLPTTDSRQHP